MLLDMNDLAKISLFKDRLHSIPVKDILLYNFYFAVMNGDYKAEVEEIRAYPDKVKELKKKLPGVTISGTFKERNGEGLIQHSGRICIDIDGKENSFIKDWEEVRNTLGTWKEVEFASLSASGKGVFLVVVITYPAKHLLHYLALERGFKKFGIKIDNMCKDLPRLRFMTYDKDAVLNERVTPYQITYQEPKRIHTVKKNSNDDLEKVINEIVSKGLDLTNCYKNWYQIGCALANEYGYQGRNHFHRLSQINPDYKLSDCDKQYDKCLKNPKGYSKSTIFYYINQCNTN